MDAEKNKALIRRWLQMADDGFAGDFEAFFTPDYQGHVSGRIHQNLEELKVQEKATAESFSRARRAIEELLAIDDKVVLRVIIRAKHTGHFQGISPTGRDVVISGIVIYRIVGERIAESWGEIDFAGLWRQLTVATSA